MLEKYGPGCFNDFLWIYENSEPGIRPNIEARTREASEILAGVTAPVGRHLAREFGVSLADLVQWGSTDNADWLSGYPSAPRTTGLPR
ncbi:hypothetical protein GCM10017752_41810 [Streptomyces roseoviridis]